jgi:transcriptional regulator with XRE-family HTH domain
VAKIKTRSRPGALSELLKRKGMTQMDAKEKTGVDRKTLSKIDRGGEVKRETLQQVANKLQVPEGYFSHPVSAVAATDDSDASSGLEPGTTMLRKLDWARLEELLKGAKNVRWHLKAQVRDDATRIFLKEFEQAVEFHRARMDWDQPKASDGDPSLGFQLDCLKAADDIAARLEALADHGLALLGADYLFWDCENHSFYESEYQSSTIVNYLSSRTVLLSVEPAGAQSRREPIFQGSLPPDPRFAPRGGNVFVNGDPLSILDHSEFCDPDDIPF